MTADRRAAPTCAYTSGDWTVLVRGRILAAFPARSARTSVGAVWDAMDDDAGIVSLLPLVSGGAGAEPAAMTPFALASTGGGLHVILRGPVTLTVTGATGSATYSGERATTWAEHLLDDAFSSFTLTCGPAASTEPSLPLLGGAVLAGAVTVTPAGSGAGMPTDAAVAADAPADAAADGGAQRAGGAGPDRARTASLPAVPLAEPGSLGAMDPELEAEPSPAVGEHPDLPPAYADAAGADAATGPPLVVTSVPSDVADPSVASAVEPLAPETSPADAEAQGECGAPDGRSVQ